MYVMLLKEAYKNLNKGSGMWKEFNGQVQSKKQIHKNIMKLQLLISYHWTLGHCGDSSLKKLWFKFRSQSQWFFKPAQGG